MMNLLIWVISGILTCMLAGLLEVGNYCLFGIWWTNNQLKPLQQRF